MGRGTRARWVTTRGTWRVLVLGERSERKRSHVEGKGKSAVTVQDSPLIVQPVALVRLDGPVGQRSVVVDYAPACEIFACPDVRCEDWPPELWHEWGPPPAHLPDWELDAGPPPAPMPTEPYEAPSRKVRRTGPERTEAGAPWCEEER